MVVSKDNKRRRKETETPPPPTSASSATTTQQSAAAAAATVESSPEMPKRTKVQAQRKFAQGQSAPTSSSAYSSALNSASSSATTAGGPSTSTAETQPPIEILPNKCPKPQDFLTFLCFRGTPALPPHLDYLNQGKSKETDSTTGSSNNNSNKKNNSRAAANSKKKRGRPAKGGESTSKAEVVASKVLEPEKPTIAIAVATKTTMSDQLAPAKIATTEQPESDRPMPPILAGAVRKRAEVVTEGNRRGGRRSGNKLATQNKCNTSVETKRRSNRAATKESKPMVDGETDEEEAEEDGGEDDDEEDEDEYFSAHDASSRNGGEEVNADPKLGAMIKTAALALRKSETPSKDSDAGKSAGKRGRPASKKTAEAAATDSATEKVKEKDKAPVKRVRQRESPIFIPSPESSGRMTRQRAFFEPVKVPPHDDSPKSVEVPTEPPKELEKKTAVKKDAKIDDAAKNAKETKEKTNSSIYAKDAKQHLENGGTGPGADGGEDGKGKNSLNVFDFSSDDEQPLAKAIKLKKGGKGNSPKKGTAATTTRGRKSAGKKQPLLIEEVAVPELKVETPNAKAALETVEKTVEVKGKAPVVTPVTKRGKTVKKKADDSLTEQEELAPPSPKKAANAPNTRQPRKTKGKAEVTEKARSPSPPQRSQRPSRKTKEAAAIYMGIIGHKLQLADDEDDDLSLSSFPDIPNVKEMEKMEKEIKKNAASGKLIVPEASTGPTAAKNARKPSPKPPLTAPQSSPSAAELTIPAQSTVRVVTPELPTPVTTSAPEEKPTPPRRGRPPKQTKNAVVPPPKREIEGMLVKKGALAKIATNAVQQHQQQSEQGKAKAKSEQQKVDSDEEEDFLINEELNETKRKLEKSFSDSDDEPLAIKVVPPKSGSVEKQATGNVAQDTTKLLLPKASSSATTTTAQPSTTTAATTTATMPALNPTTTTSPGATQLTMLPLTAKPSQFGPLALPVSANSISPPSYAPVPLVSTSTPPAAIKPMEKKSPVPTSKILNVPATYALPGTALGATVGGGVSGFQKTTSYLPQASPHYHTPYVRPPPTPAHQFPGSSGSAKPPAATTTSATIQSQQQSPLKYQTPPTTYPPPIEAYQCPKINPNFLTPKYERSALPRANNSFPSPSPVKFDAGRGLTSLPTPVVATTGSGTIANPALTSKSALPPPLSPAVLSQVSPQVSSVNLSMSNSTSSVLPTAPPPPTTTVATASTSAAAAAAVASAMATVPTPPPAHSGNNNTPVTTTSADPLKDAIGSILAANLMPSKEESGKIFGIASVSLAQSSGPDNTKCTLGKCGSIHKPVLGPVVPTENYFGDQLSSKERRKAKVNMTHEQIQKWLIECSSNPDEIQDDLDDDFDDSLRPNQSTTPPPTRDDKESTTFSSSSKNTRELGKSESAWSAKGPSLKATPVVAAPGRKEEESKDDLDYDKAATPVNLTQKSNAAVHEPTTTTTTNSAAATDKKLTATLADKKAKDASKTTATTSTAAATSAKDNNTKNQQHQQQSQQSLQVAGKRGAVTPTPATPPPVKQNRQNKKNATAAVVTPTSAAFSANATQKQTTTPATPKRTPVYNQKAQTKAQAQEAAKQQATANAITTAASQKRGAAASDSVYAFGKEEETATAPKPTTNRRKNLPETNPAAPPASVPNALSERSPTKKRAAAAAAATAVQLTLSPTENCKLLKVGGGENKGKASGRGAKKQVQSEVTKNEAAAGDSDAEGATFYIPLQGAGVGGNGDGGIQGVAVKLGREGPDGPNQKVVMQATLVTKAQMDTNSKPLPEALNTNELVKTLLNAATNDVTAGSGKKSVGGSASNSLKSAPTGRKPELPSTSAAAAGGNTSLVRVNSNSSLFSGSAKSRTAAQASSTAAAIAKKYKDDTPIKMANNTAFPRHDDPTQMVEAPIFRPTEKEFADPIEFIERITPIAARFGICKIVPPATFKPECRISDEMRFTAYNQYVHKMLHRWGPSAKELSAIKKYLATQSIVMNHPPWIGGMEVDLPRLYHTVQELGGLKEVIEKKKWARVAEEMCIPKLAQDRVTKLDDIYCKYLLPYDTLSPAERQKLFDEVEADWAKREARARRNADRFVNTESVSNEEDDVSSDEDEESEEEIDGVSMECIVKGRSMPLSQFFRIARNTMALWFKNTDPTVNEVEAEFWRHVAVRDSHVCVHSGSIDSSGWGYGFPSPGPKGKGSNYARHPWNLKVLTNNASSVLRSLGPVMGVTVPTLHVGMLFSACCWYRDPHGLSWIEYLHTGASKLWYGIPDDQSANFRAALTSLIPTHCQNKTIWLPCDTVMVPPHMLTDRGVSLCRIEQKPGEFIVVFPRAYTSSLATGYVVSESVYFATMSWLDLAKDDFRDIHESCEPAMFSLEQLLFALGYDQRVNSDTLQQMLPMLNDVCEKESAAREQLRAAGVTSTEKVQSEKGQKAKKQQQPPYKSIESECDLCRANLYISMVRTEEGNVYCLQHALKNLNNGNIQAKQCKLIYAYNVDDIQQLIRTLQEKIHQKLRQTVTAVKKK
ncbi:mucin-5AC [Scaptodrosophila lebanonensis]|uniref:Mucin-5AC n=1 Tax=Drosophila lebanonensis TaxID=7225 RepID=A0A6J2UGG0_DROLE|nr:mucin-5AC [Scaptodrosophila lebanonensis]